VARILIADDHALVREGLRTMLSGEEGIDVIAEAKDGRQALTLCRQLRPHLVLMDVRMPVMDGLEATRKIKAEMPKTSVMMVTMHENPDYLFEAVKAGCGLRAEGRFWGEALECGEEDAGRRVASQPGACDETAQKAGEGE
jgi:DNA-binding NarL/FixJ family response regulator